MGVQPIGMGITAVYKQYHFFSVSLALSHFLSFSQSHIHYSTILLFKIAMENVPFIDGLPIKNGDFPWLC